MVPAVVPPVVGSLARLISKIVLAALGMRCLSDLTGGVGKSLTESVMMVTFFPCISGNQSASTEVYRLLQEHVKFSESQLLGTDRVVCHSAL